MEENYREIWKKLSMIDVSGFVEKKGPNKLSYISWAHAWNIVMAVYPDTSYQFDDTTFYPDGSAEVQCTVRIKECERKMWLAVMDHANKPVKNPNSVQIANAKMRCLVKCLAIYGLAHNLYAGEDLPSGGSDKINNISEFIDTNSSIEEKQNSRKHYAKVIAIETFLNSQETEDQLESYYKENKNVILNLPPVEQQYIIDAFSKRKQMIKNGEI